MKKSICFILAMIYLCCFLTGCETAGLPEMERAEKGGIIFQGNLYVNKTSYGSFKGNVEAKKEKIGWYPGYYFSRMPVYTLGTDEDYVVLWGEQGDIFGSEMAMCFLPLKIAIFTKCI